ncbi:MAG: hypothetical protein ACJ74Z_05330 [Bryobacteraceae bacterium]
MVETLIEKSEIRTEEKTSAKCPNHILRSSAFKYYIHDGIDVCRFQLIGELTEADLLELHGCWRTAKTTLTGRKLILDLRALNSIDEAGKNWLAGMAAEGAEYLRGTAPAENTAKPRRFRKLAGILRALGVPSVKSSTQAQ